MTAATASVQGAVGARGWTVVEIGGVALLTLFAFVLRLACLDQSLFGDELFLYAIVHDQSLGQVLSVVHETEKTPPLGFVLSWLTERWGGPELVRVPCFVVGVATVPLVYLLGRRTVRRAAATVAATWFAISPFEIFYGTEARSYAVVAALVVLSTLALLNALERYRLRWWALYVVAATAAVYTHYIAALALVPQAAWALWSHREATRPQLTANAFVVAAFLPWVPSFLVQFDHSSKEAEYLSKVVPLTASQLAEISAKSLVGHPFVSLADLPGPVSLAMLGVALLVSVAVLVRDAVRSRPALRPMLSGWPALMVLLALFPLVGLALYSVRPDTSFLLARNLSIAVPYALLLTGWLLTRARGRLAVALPVVALAAVALGSAQMLSPDYRRPDARGAARFIDARAAAKASVVDVQIIARFHRPPARATRIYLERRHRIYPGSKWAEAWRTAARARARVVVSFPRTGIARLLVPPPEYAARYRLVAEQTSKGAPFGMAAREYAPR